MRGSGIHGVHTTREWRGRLASGGDAGGKRGADYTIKCVSFLIALLENNK